MYHCLQFLHLNVPLQYHQDGDYCACYDLLWGAPVFYCLPGIIISILPPFSQGCSKRALKKEFYCRTGLVFCRGSVITQVGNMTFYTSSVYSQKSRPRTDVRIVALT